MKTITVEGIKNLITKMLVDFDEDFNKDLRPDEDWMKSTFSKNPEMAFDDYPKYVEFRFDGELYEIIHREWIESFADKFESTLDGLSINWEFYSSSIIHFYKH